MGFLGIDVTEWAALITLLGAIVTVIMWLVKKLIIEPLMEQIHHLSDTINELSRNFNSQYKEHQKHLTSIDDRIDKQDVKLENHNTRITNLENLNDIRKENVHEHESNN